MHDVRHPAQNVISLCRGLVLQCVMLCTLYLALQMSEWLLRAHSHTALRNTKRVGWGAFRDHINHNCRMMTRNCGMTRNIRDFCCFKNKVLIAKFWQLLYDQMQHHVLKQDYKTHNLFTAALSWTQPNPNVCNDRAVVIYTGLHGKAAITAWAVVITAVSCEQWQLRPC